ncbi:TerC/Alx family metal homeostasis membrane protein, partial [bacterium]|nr:TerC/Alx family metal homeostasis membrane protein [bacterium]
MDFNHIIFWVVFSVVVAILLFVDLYVTDHRKGKITVKTSLIWSAIWIGVSLLFNAFIFIFLENGRTAGIQFFSAYIIEKSLSVDNLFVFLMIFTVMGIKPENQPHVLQWGILTAIVMRVLFILVGVALIHLFHPIIYVFGFFLFYAAYRMAFGKDEKIDAENNILIKFFKKRFNLITDYEGKKFFIKKDNKRFITPVFLTFLLIESSDLIFAVDSIPAVLAISSDPFIAITSNIFAILGLRALYFALSGIVDMFDYLKYGVAVI